MLLTVVIGIVWLLWSASPTASLRSQTNGAQAVLLSESKELDATIITAPIALTMNSTPFLYTNTWQVNRSGADPLEPADPWQEPAGRLRFSYLGSELALLLAVGNYWGYFYVTVDGEPANLLPHLSANRNSMEQAAGYRTFYAPELTEHGEPVAHWLPIHRAADPTAIHQVEIEIWRSWGQIPLRGVAVDALPDAPRPMWPGVAFLLVGGWLFVLTGSMQAIERSFPLVARRYLAAWLLPGWGELMTLATAIICIITITIGIAWALWQATVLGLLLLAWVGLQRPVLWISTLLLGLPFYFTYTLPILPGHEISLIDIGVLGGFVLALTHRLLQATAVGVGAVEGHKPQSQKNQLQWLIYLVLGAIVSWALLTTLQAIHRDVAWREWRTVFFYAALFGATLALTTKTASRPATTASRLTTTVSDQTLLVGAWLLGSTIVALVALWQYGSDTLLIQAEGVLRVRAFYGSPNNLALYLERTLAVLLALALFTGQTKYRWLYLLASIVQTLALILTFSKGALLLGLPALLAVLWLGGWFLLQRSGASRRPLWWLIAFAMAVALILFPFLGTERFRRLLDFEEGTGFVRLQLWQSSWQMALDHPWFGVGPDNFLYAYRSRYLLPAAWQEPNLNHPHNWLLDWWTRFGLPGLVLAISWFSLIVMRQWRQMHIGSAPVLALGLLAATVAALAHGLIDASYALPDLILIWVLIGYLPYPEKQES